jgi:hypothetical protein
MKKITKINSQDLNNKYVQDKTDWKRVYQANQKQIDNEAQTDKDNPIVKVGKVRRINGQP